MLMRILIVFLLAVPMIAQEGICSEQVIRQSAEDPASTQVSNDIYVFSFTLGRPLIGRPSTEKSGAAFASEHSNVKRGPTVADRIVLSQSGEMAYEYGTTHMSFDDRDTGKHSEYTAGYLRVWKSVDGSCKLAAAMYQPMRR